MANPFLMDDDLDGGDVAVNPFLMHSEPETTVGEAAENPFGESASNPFAFGGDELDAEPEAGDHVPDIDPAMSFFGTTIEAEDDALSLKSAAEEDDEAKKSTAAAGGAPPRPQPPQSTQELISTVSSQLDETSSELLGRIPATRSPSPISMRDLHSPSPTPDSGLADLLDVDVDVDVDVSDSGSSGHAQPLDADLMGGGMVAPSDNPFGVEQPPPPPPQSEPEPEPQPQPELIVEPATTADVEPEVEVDVEPEAGPLAVESDQSPPTESAATTQAVHDEPEQMDTGLDFPGLASGQLSANPFASPEEEDEPSFAPAPAMVSNIFAVDEPELEPEPEPEPEPPVVQPRQAPPAAPPASSYVSNIFAAEPDEFDAFSAKFESVKKDNISILDGFGGGGSGAITPTGGDAWGDSAFGSSTTTANAFGEANSADDGFGNEDDDFYAMQAPARADSVESVDKEFSVVIRPKAEGSAGGSVKRTDSQDTPQTPLYDEDVSQPLEEFPRLHYVGPGWEMQLRQPNKKKITGQRFWKKIFVRLVVQNDVPVVQLLNQAGDKQPFQELPLQPSYSVSEIGAQQYDQFGKIFTMKLQYIFYKERPGVRPGQVTKAERITNKLTKFAQYAIAGDYEGVKEFGSDLKKLGLPVEHAPQSSQLFKIGTMNYEDMKQFSVCIEEALFKLPALRERALTYKMEEVQVTAVDEITVEQDYEGKILKQIARVRLFFLAFLTGMPTIELGVNDMWRQGKEVVGRHDIIPVATEEWIRLEAVEFHSVVNQQEYERTRTIKFQPPDANYIELLRFRVRPPKNRELPLQLKATWCVTGNKVELRADILVPGFTSRKLGQIPCEDVSVRFPIPECWIYLFRVEKHFRYGSVKSAHRRTGKIKGIERILGAVDTLQESLIEVTSGQAKYEHHHRAIVWRCPRLPKEGQGAYTTHQLVCRMALTSYDQIPSELAPYAFVEFTMPATQVSHTTVRSVSVQDSDADEPPEKYVRYLARHEYKVGIETTHGESTNAYLAATRPIREESSSGTGASKATASPVPPSDSDSDSN
ncbi:hypothetical protein KR093_002402 [Drosophila rubida]|uniref:Protein stoned-B n=1 Tax=Drosophila rubida TaxID=30044 RepID=A0AAD4PPM0_9MUSC|nr:hypothetical protein KR093_002402 [Drosophila rubida]